MHASYNGHAEVVQAMLADARVLIHTKDKVSVRC